MRLKELRQDGLWVPRKTREQLENLRSQAKGRPRGSKSVGKNTGEHNTQVPLFGGSC